MPLAPAPVVAAAPAVAVRAEIRAERARQRRVLAVLDDDPTGSQAVHDIDLVTGLDAEALAAGLASPHGTCFALTNSRGLDETEAVELNAAWTATIPATAAAAGWQADIVSRGDSTLRGHVIAEPAAIARSWRAAGRRPFDAIVFAPAYFEAGRFTRHGRHYAIVDGIARPVGETTFAGDATFGYRQSDLRRFLAERSGGAVDAGDVALIDLDVIRDGGADAVAERVDAVGDGLGRGDVMLCTSRSLAVGGTGDESLRLSRTVSLAVADIVTAALDGAPRWIIAKGGITAHDVAVHGIGLRRGRVLGQLFDGIVSVVQPLDADRRAAATPFVVFAGNVGTERSLADAIAIMRAVG